MDELISFGAWLRQRRRTLDLTQELLAEQVGCSVAMIRKIESDERRPSRQVAELLADVLEVATGERATFLKMARGEQRVGRLHAAPAGEGARPAGSHPEATPPPRDNLPAPLTPLLGRERELVEIGRMLGNPQCRLLTLTGPGGIGKTRLAVEAAYDQRQVFADGVFFVALAPLTSAEFITPAVATALGLTFRGPADPKAQLLNQLSVKRLLLVLDNVEHLLDGSRVFADILQQAPEVKMLVTSRERLSLQGEWVLDIQGLPFPDEAPSEGIEAYSAMALFVHSARRVHIDFELAREDYPWVARICQLVEGLPLAIELAAAWVRVLSCREIAQEIERNLGFLEVSMRDMPARHRSLRAAFDHSWNLLTDVERRVYRGLSVFRGGFPREAAERVAGASLPVLAALVDKSLLRRMGARRYDLHELLRQHAREQLLASGESDVVQQRHLDFFLEFAEEARRELAGAEQVAWLNRLDLENDNLRVALGEALRAGQAMVEPGLRVASSLWRFWVLRGYLLEGRQWLEQLLAGGRSVSASVRAQALQALGTLARNQGAYPYAKMIFEQVLALNRERGDKNGVASALNSLGIVSKNQGDFAQATRFYEESLALRRELGDPDDLSTSLNNLGVLARRQGDYPRAKLLLEESLALSQSLGDKQGLAMSYHNLANVVRHLNDNARAFDLYQISLALCRELGDKSGIATAINSLALVARNQGDAERAIALHEESLALRREVADKRGVASSLNNLGWAWLAEGETGRAKACFEESLALSREQGDKHGGIENVHGLAALAVVQRRSVRGARLLGAVDALRDAVGAVMAPDDYAAVAHYLTEAQAQLDAPAFAAAWADGRTLTLEQAIESALTAEPSSGTAVS